MLRRELKEKEEEALRSRHEKEEAHGKRMFAYQRYIHTCNLTRPFSSAQLSLLQAGQIAQYTRAAVKRMRRATRTDDYVDAPMKELLGLGIVGLDRVADATLIKARKTLYHWVMVRTE